MGSLSTVKIICRKSSLSTVLVPWHVLNWFMCSTTTHVLGFTSFWALWAEGCAEWNCVCYHSSRLGLLLWKVWIWWIKSSELCISQITVMKCSNVSLSWNMLPTSQGTIYTALSFLDSLPRTSTLTAVGETAITNSNESINFQCHEGWFWIPTPPVTQSSYHSINMLNYVRHYLVKSVFWFNFLCDVDKVYTCRCSGIIRNRKGPST